MELSPERQQIKEEALRRIQQGMARAADLPHVEHEPVDEGKEKS